ncbi:MAG: LysR substrate-binding domain-containing protein [Methyloceanibacter sp.]
MSQPALSMQIKELEEVAGQPDRAPEVGDRADRAGRGNRQARAYHLASVRDVLDYAKHRERVLPGALKLGAIPSIAPYLLSAALPELQRRSPNLTLHLRETITETLVRELVSGDLDLILVALPSRVTRPLPAIRRCPFADW